MGKIFLWGLVSNKLLQRVHQKGEKRNWKNNTILGERSGRGKQEERRRRKEKKRSATTAGNCFIKQTPQPRANLEECWKRKKEKSEGKTSFGINCPLCESKLRFNSRAFRIRALRVPGGGEAYTFPTWASAAPATFMHFTWSVVVTEIFHPPLTLLLPSLWNSLLFQDSCHKVSSS